MVIQNCWIKPFGLSSNSQTHEKDPICTLPACVLALFLWPQEVLQILRLQSVTYKESTVSGMSQIPREGNILQGLYYHRKQPSTLSRDFDKKPMLLHKDCLMNQRIMSFACMIWFLEQLYSFSQFYQVHWLL